MKTRGTTLIYLVNHQKINPSLLTILPNLPVYNYYNEDTKIPGPESGVLPNQTRPKASCRLTAAFVTSPPFLQASKARGLM